MSTVGGPDRGREPTDDQRSIFWVAAAGLFAAMLALGVLLRPFAYASSPQSVPLRR
jgi:hypothetical protein